MPETFAQYLEKWLKLSTAQGLNNPLVKMPVKRFRPLLPLELATISKGGTMVIGTLGDAIARNLHKNFRTCIRERGEHCAFISFGSVELKLAAAAGQPAKAALLPVCLKRVDLQTSGEHIKASVGEDAVWTLNPVLAAHLKSFGIVVPDHSTNTPEQMTDWVRAQLGNRGKVTSDAFVGLFSSQQMVIQRRFTEPPLRQALAKNQVIQAKLEGAKIIAEPGEPNDDGMEGLGLTLPCDDSQLQVVQLSNSGCSLQVEGPPGTGKSQTIANIISNALYHGRNVLLVCDKKPAIAQVEDRLSNCGLKPALLNLHDEDLDKREFLHQAIDSFAPSSDPWVYPFSELRETRKVLNDRVRFGRAIAHPSLQVTRRDALAGMIQLRKELKNVPNVAISNWQSLSKERLTKLLNSLGEWPGLGAIVTNNHSVWNFVNVAAFDENANATNELQGLVQSITSQIESLEQVKEWAAAVGIEANFDSDESVRSVSLLVASVQAKPACYPKVVGNAAISRSEREHLQKEWEKRESLVAERHPVSLRQIQMDGEQEAKQILSREQIQSWADLSAKKELLGEQHRELIAVQEQYRRLCDRIGLAYSPLLKVRRAQIQSVVALASLRAVVPREWWKADSTPVLSVANWKAHFKACADQAKSAPLPLHFVALDRVAKTHWRHVEAKAEHGFNLVSYCLGYVDDRKCKYALRQVFPTIPTRGFKQWQEVTLHAVSALHTMTTLRGASESHSVLKQLSSAYLSIAHESPDHTQNYLSHEEVLKLEKAAALVEQSRLRNDLFEVGSPHRQTFWEGPDQQTVAVAERLLAALDSLNSAGKGTPDDLEEAVKALDHRQAQIELFLQRFQTTPGDSTQPVLRAFQAQREYAHCQKELEPLNRYLALQPGSNSQPDWDWLESIIEWRDTFEDLRGTQKLDVDSSLWPKLRERLSYHQETMARAYGILEGFFSNGISRQLTYPGLGLVMADIMAELPRYPLWLEKKRWHAKIAAYPEIQVMWGKVVEGAVAPEQAQRLFCFNLLRLCEPVAKPHGPELKQTLKTFAQGDEKLASWVIDHLKASLRKAMVAAGRVAAQSETQLRHLASLKRIKGTVRELLNVHSDYLLQAKRCWMMSATSLANLVDSQIFDAHGVPFDLVIFDEASQIRVLDGLLAMAFGKQVIIVGDKNQLPPTNFFASFASDTDDETDMGISESLLEEFGGVFEKHKTQVMLMSHYRSETPDLIRFSNDWFYEGKLEMYPPARITGIGRKLHYVSKAVYSETAGQRNNPIEAGEVVKLIELHVKDSPDKSLGVVTMNVPQMDLIEDILQREASLATRAFCADESKFFIRNLETVQGDEMDRIILSLTYGKNTNGKFNAAVLGPLTRSGGERRLNVAITRSRSGLTVVSSLRVADLETTTAQSKGFACLKAFLLDLENAEQTRNYGIGSRRFERKQDGVSNTVFCDSPFEEQVVEFLENEGYEIECQYGAGKFRLDIVVKENGRNILAVECDGAAYHSSLVARTRDRARQRVLEKLGWRFHRVWSTNWWNFEQQEKEAIVAAINSARGIK